jgi:hypothetical protein
MATGVKLGQYAAIVRNLEKDFSELEKKLKNDQEKIKSQEVKKK